MQIKQTNARIKNQDKKLELAWRQTSAMVIKTHYDVFARSYISFRYVLPGENGKKLHPGLSKSYFEVSFCQREDSLTEKVAIAV